MNFHVSFALGGLLSKHNSDVCRRSLIWFQWKSHNSRCHGSSGVEGVVLPAPTRLPTCCRSIVNRYELRLSFCSTRGLRHPQEHGEDAGGGLSRSWGGGMNVNKMGEEVTRMQRNLRRCNKDYSTSNGIRHAEGEARWAVGDKSFKYKRFSQLKTFVLKHFATWIVNNISMIRCLEKLCSSQFKNSRNFKF